jgi:hypothetical protein
MLQIVLEARNARNGVSSSEIWLSLKFLDSSRLTLAIEDIDSTARYRIRFSAGNNSVT